MTAHELANKLLDGPDLPVTVLDGCDPSDYQEVTHIDVLEADENRLYFSMPNYDPKRDSHIELS